MSNDTNVDASVDSIIQSCLNIHSPQSFFLFAGAGSGKTRSLVEALKIIKETEGKNLKLNGKQVAIITYTTAARDEINRRLDFDAAFSVSTIHSFIWDLIQGYNIDIKNWLSTNLQAECQELQDEIVKSRQGTKTRAEKEKSLESKRKRMENLANIKKFIYSPTGDNRSRDSLSHAEVIKIGAYFLEHKPLMQEILINKYPIVLIDESQDTNKHLMEALLGVQNKYASRFGMGLFGDTMQRIYSDGKVDLGRNLPADWKTPAKKMNYRSPKRVIQLINKIRSAVDNNEQQARNDASDGYVRLFIANSNSSDKFSVENSVRGKMAATTQDSLWSDAKSVKTLILEHHMAAKRMNFFEMFNPIYQVDEYKTGLRDGSLPFLKFFASLVWPTIKFKKESNQFSLAAHVKAHSPLLSKETIQSSGENQVKLLEKANAAVETLWNVYSSDENISFLKILREVNRSGVFEIPDSLKPFIDDSQDSLEAEEEEESTSSTARLTALRNFLEAPFRQIINYSNYISNDAPFGTHQGVKGLEFPRVLVIADDEEAGGFLFSYEKLFGAKTKTDTDLRNEREGKETGIDRTRRLFYVTCSRAEEGLAILAYSGNPQQVKQFAIGQGWFSENEIEVLP